MGSKRPPPASGPSPQPGLHIVSTPIGNARDITLRALDTLAAADAVLCEDTRVTSRLMALYSLATPLIAYHEHNAERVRPAILQRLAAGQVLALVSDAGTPLISDPGYRLVEACRAAGHPVTAVPGASSVLTALVLSGLPSDRFLFAGFLPSKGAARQRAITEIADAKATLVIFEAARRLPAALADLAAGLGPRPAAVSRELTKRYEEVRQGPLDELAEHYRDSGPPKGEVVLVIAPALPESGAGAVDMSVRLDGALLEALREMSASRAAREVSARLGVPRRAAYSRALALSDEGARPEERRERDEEDG